MKTISYDEAQELACAVLGLDYDTFVNENREDEIDDALYEKLEVTMEQFQSVASALLSLTPPIGSELTNTIYNAFGKEDDDMGCWLAICKMPVNG